MNRSPTLADILGHAGRNGLYRLAPGVAVPGGIQIEGKRLIGREAMFGALAEALRFPDYFGANWDALEECLADLSWLEGPVALVIDAAGEPERRAPEEWGLLIDILAEAARVWEADGRAFSVFLAGGHAAYPMVKG